MRIRIENDVNVPGYGCYERGQETDIDDCLVAFALINSGYASAMKHSREKAVLTAPEKAVTD